MEYIMISALGLMLIVVSVFFLLYRIQLKSLKKQIEFITKQDTNLVLFSDIVPVSSIQTLTDAINNLVIKHRKLEIELNKTSNRFKETITNISHDLRTPLTSANGYLQMLEDDNVTKEKKKYYLQIIRNRIDAVSSMLDELFEYARIEAGERELQQEKIIINTILEEAICGFYDDFRKQHRQAILQITEKECLMLGDKEALKRIFQNLIKNALAHGIGDFTITLQEQEKNYMLTFTNQTDSIEKQDMEKIFDRFYTTDKSRTKKSTGLGLSIAKKFVLQMQGEIEASLEHNLFCIGVWFPILQSPTRKEKKYVKT